MQQLYTLRRALRRCLAALCLLAIGGSLGAVAQGTLSQSALREQLRAKRAQRLAARPQSAPTPPRQNATASGVQLYGCIIDSYGDYYEGTPGIYSFNTADPSSVTLVKSGVKVYGGGTYGGGSLYAISYTESEDGRKVTFPVNLKQYNVSTWEQQRFAYGMQFSCIATDLAYDPTSAQVYGCFCDAENYGTYVTLGRIVYGDNYTYSCEPVGQLPERMVALTASAKGQLYGVGASGKFYTIDKHSAAATMVGATGVVPVPLFQSAACDYKTGKVYWAAMYGDDWDSGIFEIDPATGHATLVTDWGQNGTYTTDEVTGLYIVQDEPTVAAAPSPATDVKADFADGSLSGKVSFTLPTTDTKGQTLTGELSYTVRANGDTVAEGKGQPGQQVSADVTLAQSGLAKLAVTVGLNGAESEPASVSVFVGNDAPAAPADVKAEAANGTVNLSWQAVTTTENGAPIDASATTYRVTRQPDGVVVAKDTTVTSLTDKPQPTEVKATYTYEVVARYEGRESKPAVSNEVTIDHSIGLPYDNDFDKADQLQGFTMLDANGDGVTWQHNAFNGSADYPGAKANADDWLVTPPIYMEAGALYRFSFDASNSYPTERLEACIGTSLQAESFTHKVIEPTDITYKPRVHQLKGSFIPETSGYYYFGIHAISKGDLSTIHVDNLHIDQTPATAPAAVTGLTVTAGAEGAPEAAIAFAAPTKCINGQPVEGPLSVNIDCDGQTVTTLSGVEPGQACSYKHESVAEGLHTYTVTALTADGTAGQDADAKCYVGTDVPGPVRNLRAVEDLDHEGLIHLTWDAPERGQNGGYLNPRDLSYYVSVGTQGSDVNVNNETHWDDQLTIDGKQTYQGYSVYAMNNVGSGRNVWQTVVVVAGPAVVAPMVESFPNMTQKSGPWIPQILKGEIGEAYWDISSGLTYESGTEDMDGGVLVFTAQSLGRSSRLSTPKVDLRQLAKPVLNFYAYCSGKADQLRVTISPEYGDYETLLTLRADSLATGWHRFSVPLDKYKDKRFVQVGFEGTSVVSTGSCLAVDNVSFVSDAACDLMALGLTGPDQLHTGDQGEFVLTLRNNGSAPVKGDSYTVELLRNGQSVSTTEGVDLDADQTSTVTLTDEPSVFDGDHNSYQAVIRCEADADESNNRSTTVTVPITHTIYPAPAALTATNNGGVALTWQASDLSTMPLETTVEGFDSYEAFAIDGFGPWKTVDRDKQKTIVIALNVGGEPTPLKYPHAGEPMAFQVFNSAQAGIPYATWDAHSGDQMLVCMSTSWTTDQTKYVPNDDWLISPAIYEGGQTLSFFAKTGMGGDYVPEQLEVLYSTTGDDVNDFVKLGQTLDVTDVRAWTKYSFDLPAGAKYFALHCVSNHKFALLLDDISYIPADASPDQLKLLGYNVYRDHELLNTSFVKETAYTDSEAPVGQTCEYHVTAVYDKGESDPSNGARITVTAVTNATADGTAHVAAASRTIVVSGLRTGEHVSVYGADGRLIARRTAATATERFGVEPGTYVVSVDNATAVKIAVK